MRQQQIQNKRPSIPDGLTQNGTVISHEQKLLFEPLLGEEATLSRESGSLKRLFFLDTCNRRRSTKEEAAQNTTTKCYFQMQDIPVNPRVKVTGLNSLP